MLHSQGQISFLQIFPKYIGIIQFVRTGKIQMIMDSLAKTICLFQSFENRIIKSDYSQGAIRRPQRTEIVFARPSRPSFGTLAMRTAHTKPFHTRIVFAWVILLHHQNYSCHNVGKIFVIFLHTFFEYQVFLVQTCYLHQRLSPFQLRSKNYFFYL